MQRKFSVPVLGISGWKPISNLMGRSRRRRRCCIQPVWGTAPGHCLGGSDTSSSPHPRPLPPWAKWHDGLCLQAGFRRACSFVTVYKWQSVTLLMGIHGERRRTRCISNPIHFGLHCPHLKSLSVFLGLPPVCMVYFSSEGRLCENV